MPLELKAKQLVRDIPDFPTAGIIFKDITPILLDPLAFRECVKHFCEIANEMHPQIVVAIESRGFLFGAPMAVKMGLPLAVVRKLGKLPHKTISEEYALEYGTNTVEMHADAIHAGESALVVDDLLATGGTALATARLIERLGGKVVGFCFLIELSFLPGRHTLRGYNVHSLIEY